MAIDLMSIWNPAGETKKNPLPETIIIVIGFITKRLKVKLLQKRFFLTISLSCEDKGTLELT